jgi:hypothetical protein
MNHKWAKAALVALFALVLSAPSGAFAQDDVPSSQMVDKANTHIAGMKDTLADVLKLLEKTREEDKDLLKLNCINEKLASVKGFLKVSEQSMVKLQEALARNDKESANHQFALIDIASAKVANLGVEAQSCAGEVLRYAGETELIAEVDPDIAELDPTEIVDDSDTLFRLPEATPFQ